jgi:pyruvate dehydrogenase E2 component (dihydrolipoamide acetyltransferase)
MIRFELPSLGADMDEGTLLEWRVAPGDKVTRGQVVAVVDTSKAAVDVEIWQDGVVRELLIEPGAKIPVGTAMATLDEPGQAPPEPVVRDEPGQRSAQKPAGQVSNAMGSEPTPAGTAPTHQPAAEALIRAARHPVTPAARRRGRELDVDVETLDGSGPHGAVTIADVERAALQQPVQQPASRAAAGEPSEPSEPSTPASAVRPVSPLAPQSKQAAAQSDRQPSRRQEMRRAIAAAMSRSKREIPHYYLSEPIPMQSALRWLTDRNAQLPISERILPAVLQLKAVALSLARTPELNGWFVDGHFKASSAIHAGVAISLRGGGLVAPAIHDVAAKPLAQLMRELADLVQRARAGSLRSSEMSDPTITVTNLGERGVESVAGIIYPPQVALVGFGRIAERPWALDGGLRVMQMVTATLSADHRVSDGHRGAIFLTELRDRLQRPEELDQPG